MTGAAILLSVMAASLQKAQPAPRKPMSPKLAVTLLPGPVLAPPNVR
jgi:hypothetical protein